MEFGERSQYSGDGDNQGEPQRPDSLQRNRRRVFHKDEGPVCSYGSCSEVKLSQIRNTPEK